MGTWLFLRGRGREPWGSILGLEVVGGTKLTPQKKVEANLSCFELKEEMLICFP